MYQVWTKEEYEGGWKRVDCPDLENVRAQVLVAVKAGKDPLVTVEVPFSFNITIKEGKTGETTKSEAKPDKDPKGKGDRQVRRGDPTAAPGLDQGSGDNSADHSAGN